jgi:predicted dehydrogenase
MNSGWLRVGLVGAGRIVQEAHLPAYQANYDQMRVVALADPNPANAMAAGDQLGIPPAARYPDAAGLLADAELDLVVVASPPAAHCDAILAAVARGLAVICEKPVCPDLDTLAGLQAAIGDAFVAVMHNYLVKPGWRQIADVLQQGRIGAPRLIRFEELADDYWRRPGESAGSWREEAGQGGPLSDNLYHAFYLAEYLLGSPLTRVRGEQAALVHPYPGGDAVLVVGRHDNGALFQGTVAWCHRGHPRGSMELVGTKGTLRYDYWSEPERFMIGANGRTETFDVPNWTECDETGYAVAFRSIADHLRKGDPPPQGLSDAYRMMWAIHQVNN